MIKLIYDSIHGVFFTFVIIKANVGMLYYMNESENDFL